MRAQRSVVWRLIFSPGWARRPLGAIEPPELLPSLRRVENRGAVETAHRMQQIASRIFRYRAEYIVGKEGGDGFNVTLNNPF
ncbi:MAG: hypothetical protein HN738_08295 [Gammaproteobacteria bacterium]|nr:hypothetical protein [Gammaproteobacteria bacterium]